MTTDTFDYIVVGGGTAGGVVAARLSEKYRVLCLEAGTRGADYVWSRLPAGVAMMYDDPAVNWRYYAEPNETTGGRSFYVPRGKLLGGSGALNGLVVNRGQPIDYDTWAGLGARGWAYKDVLPLFRKIESTTLGEEEYRGRSGPLKVETAANLSPFFELLIQSAVAAGIPSNPDYNGDTQEGVALAQLSVHRGMRQSSATQYLKPNARAGNLAIVRGAEATSLVLRGSRCIGVRYRRDGVQADVFARRETIVSCGAVNTPKLLELSGIGNPDILSRLGIAAVHDLRGVGENLRDHCVAPMIWRFSKPGIGMARRGRGVGLAKEVVQYGLFRTGLLSQGITPLQISVRSHPSVASPDIMMLLTPYVLEKYKGEKRRVSRTDGFFVYAYAMRPESTGSIHVRSVSPGDAPKIDLRLLDTEYDARITVLAVRKAREIVGMSPLADVVDGELQPGASAGTDDEILGALRRIAGIGRT